MGCDHVCLEKKKGRFWIEAGAGNLPSGSNKVKMQRRWSGLLVDCCGWVLILGSACVEIYRDWAHWESGVRCVGGKELDGQGAPIGAEWTTFHGYYHAHCFD